MSYRVLIADVQCFNILSLSILTMSSLLQHALWRQVVEHDVQWLGGAGLPPSSKGLWKCLWAVKSSCYPHARLHQTHSTHSLQFPRADRRHGQHKCFSGLVHFSAAVLGSWESPSMQTNFSRNRDPSSGSLRRWCPFLSSLLLSEHLPKLQWPPYWRRPGAASLN